MEAAQQHFIAALGKLRQCGFFESRSGQSDAQVAAALLETLRQRGFDDPFLQAHPEYSEDKTLLEAFTEPASANAYKELAAHDPNRVWAADLEADVCEENRVYERVVADYAQLSMGFLQPTEIEETWLSETGPVILSFVHEGQQFTTELPYQDDWISEQIFEFLDEAMRAQGFTSAVQAEVNTGQDVFLVRATQDERTRMERELGWSFEWESLQDSQLD